MVKVLFVFFGHRDQCPQTLHNMYFLNKIYQQNVEKSATFVEKRKDTIFVVRCLRKLFNSIFRIIYSSR